MKKLNIVIWQTICVPLKCIISHFVFRRQPADFFFSERICQMKAGQNNKYDGTKTWSKFFTYVSKTCQNYRKPRNYNGTIIFEIDNMKKSSPINENLCQTWLFHKCFGCLVCFCLHWNLLRQQLIAPEMKLRFGLDSGKSGEDFFMISTSKIMVPL